MIQCAKCDKQVDEVIETGCCTAYLCLKCDEEAGYMEGLTDDTYHERWRCPVCGKESDV